MHFNAKVFDQVWMVDALKRGQLVGYLLDGLDVVRLKPDLQINRPMRTHVLILFFDDKNLESNNKQME